jgi:hypothetical protein
MSAPKTIYRETYRKGAYLKAHLPPETFPFLKEGWTVDAIEVMDGEEAGLLEVGVDLQKPPTACRLPRVDPDLQSVGRH